MTNLIANMLSSIRNASLVGKAFITTQWSTVTENIADILYKEGYIDNYTVENTFSKRKKASFKSLVIGVKYDAHGAPVIRYTKCISKPSVRIYRGKDEIKSMLTERYSTLIISTNKGIMCHLDAIKMGIGGEVLFEVAC
jgi:small subunit ribosomal protein S8